jgi:hypothetical protein
MQLLTHYLSGIGSFGIGQGWVEQLHAIHKNRWKNIDQVSKVGKEQEFVIKRILFQVSGRQNQQTVVSKKLEFQQVCFPLVIWKFKLRLIQWLLWCWKNCEKYFDIFKALVNHKQPPWPLLRLPSESDPLTKGKSIFVDII